MLRKLSCIIALICGCSSVSAQGDQWIRYERQNGVEVYYAIRINRDEARVAWKCVNTNPSARSCSIGAGQDKVYRCVRDSSPLGFTNALGERAAVPANGEYVFPSDFACRNLGATSVEPYGVRISIEQ